MPQLHRKLSPRQQFWFGFVCCPLITWILCLILLLLLALIERELLLLPSLSTSQFTIIQNSLMAFGFLYLCSIPAFSGFCTSFFWRNFSTIEDRDRNDGFWSVVVTWLPTLIFQDARLFFLFFIFTVIYGFCLKRGLIFWNSNRPHQWVGDFSDFGPSRKTRR